MTTKISTLFTILVLVSTGCHHNMGTEPVPKDIVMTPKSLSLVSAGNSFTFNLFSKIPDSQGHNVMVSPLSISLALSMTLNGAAGSTKDSIINTLGLTGLSLDEINQTYLDLISALEVADPKVVMDIANSIWIRKSYPVLDSFITVNQKYYDAKVQTLDFDQAGLLTINNWVNAKTNGKIPTILDQISDNEIMFLINAIYFNGKWKVQFAKANTINGSFTLGSGSSANVPLMKVKDQFGYTQQSGYKALRMPYGRGKFSMVLLLPDTGKTPDQLIGQLNPAVWARIKTSLALPQMVDVWLPRFTFNWESDLNDILSSLGMSVAFSDTQANFSKINPNDQLFISKVKHKTYIQVDEEGTEAAAVTSVGIATASAGPETEFYAIRPFLFFITEGDTGAILFAGKVENPLLTN